MIATAGPILLVIAAAAFGNVVMDRRVASWLRWVALVLCLGVIAALGFVVLSY